MKQQPFFSVITICRNEERDIHLTADSVVKQTCKNYEWIVIDGASADGTLKILQKYKKRMGYFVSEKDKGIYDAMNKGIKQATGKYLIFMNGGDLFADKNVLQKVYNFIKKDKENHGIYHGEAYLHLNDIKNIRPYWYRPLIYKNNSANAFSFYIQPLPHQCCFIKKDLFLKYGIYNPSYKVYGDHEWFFRTKKETNKFMRSFVAIQNDNDWVARGYNMVASAARDEELKKIKFQYFNPLQILYYELIIFLSHIKSWCVWYAHGLYLYKLRPLHKPWRAFKRIIGASKNEK